MNSLDTKMNKTMDHNLKKKMLMIAYYAPPLAASGTFRSLDFMRHLSNLNWRIDLLTVKPNARHQIDSQLLVKLPTTVTVFRSPDIDIFSMLAPKKNHAEFTSEISSSSSIPNGLGRWTLSIFRFLKNIVSSLLKTPDLQVGWLIPSIIRCAFFIKRPDIIYSSAPPFTGHLVGVFCKILWRVPLVCDFRDPWTDNPFRFVREGWVGRWDNWLEKQVFARSDLVIANTDKVASVFRLRFPRFADKIDVVTNGYDPEVFSEIQPLRHYPADQFVLVHAGFLYGERDPTNIFKAIKLLIDKNECQQLRVVLVGSSATASDQALNNQLFGMGLMNHVQCHPSVPHGTAISLMKGADALLLISTGTSLQVPAKLFEYFGLEKPILSVAEPDSATEDITKRLSGLVYCAHNNPEDIKRALSELYVDWLVDYRSNHSWNKDPRVQEFLASMTRLNQAHRLSQHFHHLLSSNR